MVSFKNQTRFLCKGTVLLNGNGNSGFERPYVLGVEASLDILEIKVPDLNDLDCLTVCKAVCFRCKGTALLNRNKNFGLERLYVSIENQIRILCNSTALLFEDKARDLKS